MSSWMRLFLGVPVGVISCIALAEPNQPPPYKPDTPPGTILDHSPPAAGATLRPTRLTGNTKGFREALSLKDTVTIKSADGETITVRGPISGHGYREVSLKYRHAPDGKDVRGGWYEGRDPQSGFKVTMKFANFKNDKNQGADYTVIDDTDPKDIRNAKLICELRAPAQVK